MRRKTLPQILSEMAAIGPANEPSSTRDPRAKDGAIRSRTRRILGRLLAAALRVWGATWRVDFEGSDPTLARDGPVLAAMWHRDFLIAAYVFRDRSYSVPVSRSRDGSLITQALLALGYLSPPRGSSSRGGAAALLGLVRLLRAGHTVSLQTDGPRGPARRAKVGAIALSRLVQVPITPVAFAARPCLRFRSWDRTRLPLPFAQVTCHYGDAVVPATTHDDEREEQLRTELERRLNHDSDALDHRYTQDLRD
jgi:lysophospholipid acyltransferase (LPLAT)-like uncharacterized protein